MRQKKKSTPKIQYPITKVKIKSGTKIVMPIKDAMKAYFCFRHMLS